MDFVGYVVVGPKGYKSLHLEHPQAIDAAAKVRGHIRPLVLYEEVEQCLTQAYNDGVKAGMEIRDVD